MEVYNNYSLKSIKLERWVDISGWEDYYQISDFGRVKRKDRYIYNYRSGYALTKEEILKQNECRGYLSVLLCKDGEKLRISIQRLVAINFIPNTENKPTVNHKDTNKKNNFWKNLEWATHAEQQNHAVANNLRGKTLGENSNFSKLTEQNVLEIRRLFDKKIMTRIELATAYGMAKSTIQYIVNRETWKYI